MFIFHHWQRAGNLHRAPARHRPLLQDRDFSCLHFWPSLFGGGWAGGGWGGGKVGGREGRGPSMSIVTDYYSSRADFVAIVVVLVVVVRLVVQWFVCGGCGCD